MRIGLITPGFSASEDDWCVPALTDLARVLAERDEVTVFALRYPHRREPYRVHGVRVFPTGGAQRRGLARVPILMRALVRVRRAAQRRPFDVLWAWWAHEPGFVAALAGRLTGAPVLVSILGGELANLSDVGYGGDRSGANRWLAAKALDGAGGITVGSRFLWDQVKDRIATHKLGLEPLGIDLQRFKPDPEIGTGGIDGEPSLLHVASLTPVKDHRKLFTAFEFVAQRYPGARLHLVGEGELTPDLAGLLRQTGLEERVKLHGSIDHGQLAELYRGADLLVQSSVFEAQGMAVLEAVACGCPVVGTEVGVLPELSTGFTEAVTVVGDPGALAEAIITFLEDPSRRRRLAEAQNAVVLNFELRASVDRWRRRLEMLAATSS